MFNQNELKIRIVTTPKKNRFDSKFKKKLFEHQINQINQSILWRMKFASKASKITKRKLTSKKP
jgi:hypothetical protein